MTSEYGESKAVRRAARLIKRGNWSAALQSVSAVGALGRGALLLKANILQALGRTSEAEKAYRLLVGRHPKDAMILAELAEFLSDLGRARAAVPFYLRAVRALREPTSRIDRPRRIKIALDAAGAFQGMRMRLDAVRTLAWALYDDPTKQEPLIALCALLRRGPRRNAGQSRARGRPPRPGIRGRRG